MEQGGGGGGGGGRGGGGGHFMFCLCFICFIYLMIQTHNVQKKFTVTLISNQFFESKSELDSKKV